MARSKKPNNDDFKSKFEVGINKQLSAAKGGGLISDYAYEATSIPYTILHSYKPDWLIKTEVGEFYIETKGWLRSEDKRTLLAVRDQHPEYDIRIVFQKDALLYKGSKSRYSDWAERHGFKWAVGEVPKHWFD